MEDDVLIETTEGSVTVLTLNRPDSLNSLDSTLMRRLVEATRKVAEDDKVRVVVLTGAGKGFCAGGDMKASGKAADDRVAGKAPSKATTESRTRWLRRSVEASRLLHEMGKPTIAMINGACAGAGLSLAAACDFRFAAASAKFRPAFTAIGMPGDYGGSWLWTQILGPSKTRQLYMLDEKRDAQAALAFGLIDRIYADEELREKTLEVAQTLAALPPTGLSYAKNNLNAALHETFAQALDRESLNMMLARNALVEARKAAESASE